jgi:hypothetical protein
MSEAWIAKANTGSISQYTETIGQQVCERLAEGAVVTVIAVELGFHPSTLLEWRERYPNYAASYARAEQIGFHTLAEKLLTIARQEGDVQRQRLESDNIKWYLGKRNPRVYGDRLDVNIVQTIDIGSALTEARARALRPMSDQLTIDDADYRTVTGDHGGSTHDTQSLVLPAAPPAGPPAAPPGAEKKP